MSPWPLWARVVRAAHAHLPGGALALRLPQVRHAWPLGGGELLIDNVQHLGRLRRVQERGGGVLCVRVVMAVVRVNGVAEGPGGKCPDRREKVGSPTA